MTEKEQNLCTRCNKKIKSGEEITMKIKILRHTRTHIICKDCVESFVIWLAYRKPTERRSKQFDKFKKYWDMREEFFRKISDMTDKLADEKYTDESEWWMKKRFGTDKQFFKKGELDDSEKEDMK
tara:strand:+ start:2007 stop:2381 length:375 start_codon:yes stop_codon:yes gene_type:complete